MLRVDAKINQRNDSWLAYNVQEVSITKLTNLPVNDYVLGAVASGRDHMLFKNIETISKEVFLSILIANMGTVYFKRQFIFSRVPQHKSESLLKCFC